MAARELGPPATSAYASAQGDTVVGTSSSTLDDAADNPHNPETPAAPSHSPELLSPPTKRARTGKSTSSRVSGQPVDQPVDQPRRRAGTACQLCRIKKIKCNNDRPACSSCSACGAKCIYEDSKDLASFDPASVAILNRLSRIEKRLTQLPEALSRTRNPGIPGPGSLPNRPTKDQVFSNQGTPRESSAVLVSEQDIDAVDHLKFDDMRIPPQSTSPDAVLAWPVFASRHPPGYLIDIVFEAELAEEGAELQEHGTLRAFHGEGRTTGFAHGINDEEIPDLVRRFLALVHSKNPILDANTLWSYVNRVAETGITWDAATCLVLLVSALGCIAQDFHLDETYSPAGPGPRKPTSLEADRESLRKARAYYRLARRRFGLLESGILVPQCYFLAGVYTMHTMSPVKAWYLFNSASRACHLYLMCEARRSHQPQAAPRAAIRRSLEQRIYWSCYKSECELRIEMNLPNSCLADLDYPDLYPKPPDVLSSSLPDSEISPQTESTSPFIMRRVYEQEEQTWYYYLTELTLRRMQNRILNALYARDHTTWNDENMPFMLKVAEEFEETFDKWYSEMPEQLRLRLNGGEAPTADLPYLCEGRAVETQTRLYRPFLYYAAHNQPDAPFRAAVQPLVDKALFAHLRLLTLSPGRLRLHGTWYGLRVTTGSVLTLLGAAKCGTIDMPPGWRDGVVSLLDELHYWKDEVTGVSRAIEVIEEYL